MKKSILMLLLVPMLAIGQAEPNYELTASVKGRPASTVKSNPKEKPYDVSAISKYAGLYKSELLSDFEINVFIEGGKLYGIKKGETQKIEISPVSPTKFKIKGSKDQIDFMEDDGVVLFMMFAKDEMVWLTKVK